MARRDRDAPDGRSAVRCAIYTRKSTEEGLEQEFNSLDAQHEACSAYILSQRHERWVQLKDRYDDGGFSGGTMERPALKRLLADVALGKVDVIVVYKVDRLTRSLSDFAKIVDVLDGRGASFVSVTQAFNTTSSMGRLTLNVLLSFAQFEREVTGERIRDKIAASKRKGMWMGGPVPLGYRVQDRKLLIDEADSRTVRHIFERYLALGTGQTLIEELRAEGYITKKRPCGSGMRGGVPFSRGMIFSMLSNAIYIGKITHKGVANDGEHAPIIPLELWDAVQQQIEANRVVRRDRSACAHSSLLAGIIRDGHGRRMTPSHTVRGSRRYRYYITHGSEVREGDPPAFRRPAREVERAVQFRVQQLLRDKAQLRRLAAADADGQKLVEGIRAAAILADQLNDGNKRRGIVGALVRQVEVHDQAIRVQVDAKALGGRLGILVAPDTSDLWIELATAKVWNSRASRLVITDSNGNAMQPDEALVTLLREAHAARAMALVDPARTIREIATEARLCRHRFSRLVRLSWLAPEIVTAIFEGRHPVRLTPKRLLAADLPLDWAAQKALLGFA